MSFSHHSGEAMAQSTTADPIAAMKAGACASGWRLSTVRQWRWSRAGGAC